MTNYNYYYFGDTKNIINYIKYIILYRYRKYRIHAMMTWDQ